MHFIVGLLLVVALSLTPAPVPSDSGTEASVIIHAGTEGTHVGWLISGGDENIKVRIGGERSILPSE